MATWSNEILAKNIKRYMDSRNMTQKELAEIVGVSAPTVNEWLKGKKYPRIDKVEIMANYFNILKSDLIEDKTNQPISTKAHRIPVLGHVAAGIPLDMVEDILDYEEIPAKWGDPSDFFCLKIKGESMQPKMDEGDIVVVKKQADADSNDIVIFTVNGENASCKRLKKSEHGLAFIPLNTSYDPFIYSWDQVKELPVQILGKVVELRAKF